MKKFLLISGFLIFFSFGAAAQIVLSDIDGNDVTNDTITANGYTSDDMIKVNIFFTNDSDETHHVFVRKIEHYITEGSDCVFCWDDFCFTPEVIDVENPITLEPGETSTSADFYSDFYPGGIAGTSYVEFEFYSDRGSFDTVSVMIKFVITEDATSVFQPDINKWSLSDAQPNPARGHTWINYSVPTHSSNARIVIRNLLGKEVYSQNLEINSNRVRIDTQRFTNGIYIYSLMIDNQIVESKRLVVAN